VKERQAGATDARRLPSSLATTTKGGDGSGRRRRRGRRRGVVFTRGFWGAGERRVTDEGWVDGRRTGPSARSLELCWPFSESHLPRPARSLSAALLSFVWAFDSPFLRLFVPCMCFHGFDGFRGLLN
jgi:hypothetical protein